MSELHDTFKCKEKAAKLHSACWFGVFLLKTSVETRGENHTIQVGCGELVLCCWWLGMQERQGPRFLQKGCKDSWIRKFMIRLRFVAGCASIFRMLQHP